MKALIKPFLLFLGIFTFCFDGAAFAQEAKVDSLLLLIKNDRQDTNKVNHLNELCIKLLSKNLDTVLILATEALKIVTPKTSAEFPSAKDGIEENGIKIIRANTLHILGRYYFMKGDYSKSLEYQYQTLKIREELQRDNGVANCLIDIGNIYNNQGDCTQALECYLRALKIKEKLGDQKAIATTLGNIGLVYGGQKDYIKALNYQFKAEKIAEKIGDKTGMSRNLSSIGSLYNAQNDYNKALSVLLKAQKIANELGDKTQQAILLSNIGDSYYGKKDYLKALEYYSNSNIISKELGNKYAITYNFGNLGLVYKGLGKFKEAELYFKQTIINSDSLGLLESLCISEEELSSLYDTLGRTKEAFIHYKKAALLKDSLFGQENKKQLIRKEMNYEFDKKEAATKAGHDREMAVAIAEQKKQQIIIWSIIAGLFLVILFASFVFQSLRTTRKQKSIIELQKNEVSRQKEIVDKQKEKITDSIAYAQRIQQSILIEESEIQKILPESFIYFQPKDVVSGDFYWCSKTTNAIIIAAVDCTGHGVPGAFMSMIGNMLLNQIVNEKHITTPSEILQQLNIGVHEALHQNKDGAQSNDGMDISLCCIDYKNEILQYAGAHNSLYIVENGTIKIIRSDNKGIGKSYNKTQTSDPTQITFTNNVIPIKKGMSIYLFSDGYMDQFGGNERKKFGKLQFEHLLLNSQSFSIQKQKEFFISTLSEWKGNTVQTDDILVIGVKI
jgi:serine phosphatase RsbU (regulator of sigma subunit)